MTNIVQNKQNKVISLRNASADYWQRDGLFKRKKFAALKDISFELYKGDSLGIIGRNGAGKSTLLRLLGGITIPDKGSLVNYGYKTTLLSLQVGFDMQLSGRKNAILSGMLLGYHKHEIESLMDDIIKFAELQEFIDEPVRSYSSGMKARLGFSVAIYLDTDILLIDEIMAVGDADFQKKSSAIMHEKLRSDNTVVLVSHNAPIIRDLCNRAVWIEGGVTRAEGDTSEVLKEYESFLRNFKAN